MAGRTTGFIARGPALAALAAVLAIAGCEEGLRGDDAGAGTAAIGAARTTELVERDVEAPEVFQVTEQGLWDGRPSLGGVWVAHPGVTEPERVIIRNTGNGNFVIGALFRRERENPGPALQVSSDAAEALGMLAGAPAALNVTALRREEAAEPAAAPPAEGALDAPEGITASALPPADAAAPAAPAPAATAPAATPPAIPAAPAAAGTLARPFIQVGIFSVEGNAGTAADRMQAAGLSARIVAGTSQDRRFWRVLVGPAASEAERARLLEEVKALGFADAYFVRD